jgi:ethanolamine utilization protein EutN
MYLAKVVGTAIATIKEPNLEGYKMLVVQALSDAGSDASIIALDAAGAGVGETVLVLQEGGSARQALGGQDVPVNDAIVAIVDSATGLEEGTR